jgi:hypothetical protein
VELAAATKVVDLPMIACFTAMLLRDAAYFDLRHIEM